MMEQQLWESPSEETESREITALDSKITELEMRLGYLETRIPNSNIMSPKFWTRALAVFGHEMSIYLAFYGIILAIGIVFAILGAFIGVISR
jgi:hypothetical protein